MKTKLIFFFSLLLSFSSDCVAEVTVKEVPYSTNDYGFDQNYLKFYDDDTFLIESGIYDGEQFKLPFELNSSINGAVLVDKNASGEILGKVANLFAIDTYSIFVWSPTQGVREVVSFPTTPNSPQIYILGGGLSDDGTVKILYANEYLQKTLPVKLIVSRVGQAVKEFSYNTGFDTKCDGSSCSNGFGHKVLGLGNQQQLLVGVAPFGFKTEYVGLFDEGQVVSAPDDFTASNVFAVHTSDKNLFEFNFADYGVNALLTKDNTVESFSSPKLFSSADVVEAHDAAAGFGIVGDYFQRYHNESSKGGDGFFLNRWGYVLKPDGEKFERIECKIKPSLLKNLILTSALKMNSAGNILAVFKRSSFAQSPQKTALLTGYSSSNSNFCPTSKIYVGAECKNIFSTGSNGQRLSTTEKFKNRPKRCSFQIRSKIGKTALTDGKFYLTGNNGKRTLISGCRDGLCQFTINLDSNNGRYTVTGPEDSKVARNTVRFLITTGE